MSTTRFDKIKALAFDHYGTLFDKHAISELIEVEFPGHGLEVAQSWFLTTKEYCWLNGMMERHQTWDDLREAMSAFRLFMSAYPPGPDVADPRLVR